MWLFNSTLWLHLLNDQAKPNKRSFFSDHNLRRLFTITKREIVKKNYSTLENKQKRLLGNLSRAMLGVHL